MNKQDPQLEPNTYWSEPLHPLSHERALLQGETDLLNRGRFVRSFAGSLASAPRDESIVFALYGKWGEGKSSLLTLIKEEFESKTFEYYPPLVIPFSPWIFSDREKLFSAFFEDIGNSISESQGKSHLKDPKARAEAWKTFGMTASIIGRTAGDIATIASIFDLSGTSLVLSKLIKSVTNNVEESANQASKAATKQATESLAKVKEELSDEMRGERQSILIVLDDVDRLLPAELCELLQIVKALADIPNIHYLLLGHEDNLKNQLKDLHPDPKYLEKIVQYSINIPNIPSNRITNFFIRELKKTIEIYASKDERFDVKFYTNLETNLVNGPFNNLRDAKRCLGNIRLNFPIYCNESKGYFLLHPSDFILLEILRSGDQETFNRIQSSRRELVGLSNGNNSYSDVIKTFVEQTPENSQQTVIQLFNRSLDPHTSQQTISRRLQSTCFPSYFNTEDDDLPFLGYEFNKQLTENLGDPHELEILLGKNLDEIGISPIIEHFTAEFDSNTWGEFLTVHSQIMTSILTVLEKRHLSGRNQEDFRGTSIFEYIDFILRHPEPDIGNELLLNSFRDSQNLIIACDAILRFELLVAKRPDLKESIYNPLIKGLVDIVKDIIQKRVIANTLNFSGSFEDVQEIWWSHGDKKLLTDWLDQQCTSKEGLKTYLLSVSRGFSGPTASNGQQERTFLLHYNQLIPFQSPVEMAAKCLEYLDNNTPDSDDSIMFKVSAERFEQAQQFHDGDIYFHENYPNYLIEKQVLNSEAFHFSHTVHLVRSTQPDITQAELVKEFRVPVHQAKIAGGEYANGGIALLFTDTNESTMQKIAEKLEAPAFYRLPPRSLREEVTLISSDLKKRQYMGKTHRFFKPKI